MTFTPTTLFLASQNGDFEYLREYLKNNVEDNYIDYNNSSSLIIAANKGIIGQPTKFEKSEDYSKIVDLLVNSDVNKIDTVNNFNNNALTYAIAKKIKKQ